MHPAAIAAIAAVAAGTAYVFREKLGFKKPVLGGGGAGGVSELKKGTVYGVVLQLTKDTPGAPNDPTTAAVNVKAALDQSGFTTLTTPQPRSPGDAAAFAAQAPGGSTWTTTARWNMDASYVQSPTPTWIGMATFTPIPVS